jgi:hypothetical protein
MKTGYHVAFAAHPLHIVRGGAGERTVEQRMPKTAYIDHQAQLALDGQSTHMSTQSPRCVFVKPGKLELLFLQCNTG